MPRALISWIQSADDLVMSSPDVASIGIVIPVHGGYHRVIAETLDAVKLQTASPRATVVVIDGPAPDLERVVRDHEADVEILILPENSGGPATPRNVGADHLRKKHDLEAIWFLDADDIPHPRFLEVVSRSMKVNPEHDLYCTGFDLWTKKELRPAFSDTPGSELDTVPVDLEWYLARTGSILPSFTVVRTRSFSSIRESEEPFDPVYENNQDYDMFVRILHLKQGLRIEWQGGAYRMHADAISAQGSRAWLCRSCVNRDLQSWFLKLGEEELSERMRAAEGSAIRRAARHLWRKDGSGDRLTALRLLIDDIKENRSVRSLLLMVLMPLGRDAQLRRIPLGQDTRLVSNPADGS